MEQQDIDSTQAAQAQVIDELIAQIGEASAENGFHDEVRRLQDELTHAKRYHLPGEPLPESVTIAQSNLRNYYVTELSLIITEAAEAIDELRSGRGMNETYYNADKPTKPEGVPSEMVDIVIRVLDLSAKANVAFSEMFFEKRDYNATRGRLHGRSF